MHFPSKSIGRESLEWKRDGIRNGFGDCDDDNGRVVDLDFRREEEDTKRRPKSGFRRHGDDSRSSLLGVAGDEKSEVVVVEDVGGSMM